LRYGREVERGDAHRVAVSERVEPGGRILANADHPPRERSLERSHRGRGHLTGRAGDLVEEQAHRTVLETDAWHIRRTLSDRDRTHAV